MNQEEAEIVEAADSEGIHSGKLVLNNRRLIVDGFNLEKLLRSLHEGVLDGQPIRRFRIARNGRPILEIRGTPEGVAMAGDGLEVELPGTGRGIGGKIELGGKLGLRRGCGDKEDAGEELTNEQDDQFHGEGSRF